MNNSLIVTSSDTTSSKLFVCDSFDDYLNPWTNLCLAIVGGLILLAQMGPGTSIFLSYARQVLTSYIQVASRLTKRRRRTKCSLWGVQCAPMEGGGLV